MYIMIRTQHAQLLPKHSI